MIQFPYVINPRAGRKTTRPTVRRVGRRPAPAPRMNSLPESKYLTSTRAAVAVSVSDNWGFAPQDPATANQLFNPRQGDGVGERIGRKVSVTKIAIRGLIQYPQLSDQADIPAVPSIRLILFQDTQTNGVQATGDLLMEGSGTVAAKFNGFQNTDNFGRFRVLRDVMLRTSDPTAGTDGASTNTIGVADIPFKLTYKFTKPILVKYTADSASIAGTLDHSFHILAAASNANYAPTIAYQCRVYYQDM